MNIDKITIEKNNSWVNMPRYVYRMLVNGDISCGAYKTYLHLRISANPYGRKITSFEEVRSELFQDKITVNSVNKYFLELKKNKLIWFKNRRGSNKKLEIAFDDFFTSNKTKTDISSHFQDILSTNQPIDSELKDVIQKGKSSVDMVTMAEHRTSQANEIRTTNNNKNNHNKNTVCKKESEKQYKSNTSTESFEPKSFEENAIYQFLKSINAKNMDYALTLIREEKFWALDLAMVEYQETVKDKGLIGDKTAYFFGIVKRMISDKSKKLKKSK